jgi:hypothetical protein
MIHKRHRRRAGGTAYTVWRVRLYERDREHSRTFDRLRDARAFEAQLRTLKRSDASSSSTPAQKLWRTSPRNGARALRHGGMGERSARKNSQGKGSSPLVRPARGTSALASGWEPWRPSAPFAWMQLPCWYGGLLRAECRAGSSTAALARASKFIRRSRHLSAPLRGSRDDRWTEAISPESVAGTLTRSTLLRWLGHTAPPCHACDGSRSGARRAPRWAPTCDDLSAGVDVVLPSRQEATQTDLGFSPQREPPARSAASRKPTTRRSYSSGRWLALSSAVG